MAHLQPQEIQAALDTGRKVWSRAAGRWGRVTGVDGGLIEFRSGRLGRGQKCVTWFGSGDDVKLIERDDEFFIVNDFSAISRAEAPPIAGGGE